MSRRFIVGFDVAQSQDYSAIVVAESVAFLTESGRREKGLHIRHLDRFRNVAYPEQVSRVENLLNTPALRHRAELVIDGTGVGAPVCDLFRARRRGLKVVKIHGGDNESRGESDGSYRVPKRDLIGGLQALLQSGRLKLAEKLELTETLRSELLNMRITIDPRTAHDSYSAWREHEHDDLVLAACLAAWGLGKEPMIPGALSSESLLKPSYWTTNHEQEETKI